MARFDHRAKEEDILSADQRVVLDYLLRRLHNEINALRAELGLPPKDTDDREVVLRGLKEVKRRKTNGPTR